MDTSDSARADSREYFASLEDALREYKIPVENHAKIREVAASLAYDQVYIPRQSRPYIALATDAGVVAYVNWGRVDLKREDGGYDQVVLSTHGQFGPRAGGRRRGHPDEYREVCPFCFTQMPATGVCDTCGQ